MLYSRFPLTALIVTWFLLWGSAPAPAVDEEACLECHKYSGLRVEDNASSLRNFHVDGKSFDQSAHGAVTCRGCHVDISRTPHENKEVKVNCGVACHVSTNFRDKPSSHMELYNQYLATAHGKIVGRGLECTSCHSWNETKGYAGRNRGHVARLCEKCHIKSPDGVGGIPSGGPMVTDDAYHRLSVLRNRPDTPDCTNCHPVHAIYPNENTKSSVNTQNIGITCGGAYSSTRSCHTTASARFVATVIHDRKLATRNKQNAESIGLWFAMMVFVVPLTLHMLLDASNSRRTRHGQPENEGAYRVYVRMTLHQRVFHMLLIVSFLFTGASGLILWLCARPPAAGLISFVGGFENMSDIHLVGGCALAALIVYHVASLVFLAVKRDWTLSDLTLLPTRKDLSDLVQNARFFLGETAERPRFGKFSYMQRFDYFAALLGLGFMVIGGLAIGFPERAISFLVPAPWLGDLRIVHASLGYGLIFVFLVWHLYNNLFSRDTFMRNWSWLNGTISEQMMREQHAQYYDLLLREEQEESLRKEKAAEERSVEKVIQKQAKRLEEYLETGNRYAKLAQYEEAVEQYEKALELLPNFPQARYNLAAVYHKSGNITKAIVEYRKFVEMDPFNTMADKVRTLLSQLEESPGGGAADEE